MEPLLATPAFRTYALCSSILALKMILSAFYIPAFFAVGLIYVLAGATARGAAAYVWVFTLARMAHTAFYMRNLQPWRAIAFGVGVLCMFGMITQILRAVL